MEAKTNAALERQCLNRLTAAVVLSAVLHLVAYAGLQVAKRADFSLPRLPQLVKISLPAPTPVVTEKKVSLTFVTVDPDTAQTTAPKNPKFYSTHSTVAAWGYNKEGQTTVPAGLSGVVAIAAGDYHTVALKLPE